MSKYPLTIKITCWLICAVLGAIIVVYGKNVLLPIVIAALLSFLLYPLHKKLTDWKVPRVLSVIISLLLIAAVITLISMLVSTQIKSLVSDIEGKGSKINEKFLAMQNSVSSHLDLDSTTVNSYIAEGKTKLMLLGEVAATGAVAATTSFLGTFALIIIFIFCFLLYHNSFRDFAFSLLRTETYEKANSLIVRVQKLVQNYLVGLFTVTCIIGTLNSIGLLIIGVDHAIFFAFLAGMLAIIPYIGITIGASIAFIYLLLTRDTALPAFGAAGIMIFVQIMESNLITPKVVGSKVSLNPFIAMAALLVGGELWGIPGMALSIPVTAILKLLLDARPQTKTFGYFLGSEFVDDNASPFKLVGKREPKLPSSPPPSTPHHHTKK